jgi:hypothetical protein
MRTKMIILGTTVLLLFVTAGATTAGEPIICKTTRLSPSDVLVTCKNGAEVQVKKLDTNEKVYMLSCEN